MAVTTHLINIISKLIAEDQVLFEWTGKAPWLDPDIFWGSDSAVPFIFNNKLYVGHSDDTHTDIIANSKKLYKFYLKYIAPPTDDESYIALASDMCGAATKTNLLGRVGSINLNRKFGSVSEHELSSNEEENVKMKEQLHLMRPEQKRAELQKMGVTSKKNDWQKASEESGFVKPGQKWWASTSEGIDTICDIVE